MDLPRASRSPVFTGVLVVSLVTSLLGAIWQSEGFRETRVDLNEGGVWISQVGRIGRVNMQIRSIEVAIADPTKRGTDLVQSGPVVVLVNEVASNLVGIDPANGLPGDARELPADATVALGGEAGMVADGAEGKVWLTAADHLGQLDTKAEATLVLGEGDEPEELVATLGLDGRAHVYPLGGAAIRTLSMEGDDIGTDLAASVESPAISAVGGRAVLLDSETLDVVVPGGKPIPTGATGGALLQQPGPASSDVLVATGHSLLAVPLGGGEPRTLISGGDGTPSAPVWVVGSDGVGCAYAAWSDASWGRWCTGDEGVAEVSEVPGSRDGNKLRFRVNRDRVLLNDLANGNAFPVDEQDPEVIDDWDQAADRDRDETEQQTQFDQKEPPPCSESPPSPKTTNDTAGTRRGRPVIAPVLDNDESDRCDVLTVAIAPEDLPPRDVALVQVVDDASAIQVTPVGADTTEVVVRYSAVGKGGPTPSNLTVSVTPEGTNRAPETANDETVVEAGQVVQHNVLLNDSDPDGDALTLVSVDHGAMGGTAEYQADGVVTYRAPGGITGIDTLTYTVDDHMGETAQGELKIRIQAGGSNLPPTARNDRVVAVVGQTSTLDVLANDTDPNGDTLSLVNVDETRTQSLDVTYRSEGEVSITPEASGTYHFPYQISDGQEEAEAWVLVEAKEPGTNVAPVAVRDDLVVRPGVPALVDLVVNDIDEDGDVLAVTGIDAPDDAGLSIELLDMRVARVTASAQVTEPVVATYTVSDGREGHIDSGRLVIRPLLQSAEDQAPIAQDDTARVRPGNATAIPVLRNDIDPEGEQLTIVDARVDDPDQGLVFIQKDELRFSAAADVRGQVILSYDVEDPAGNSSSARVEVEIIDPSRDNQPPDAPHVEGRVFAGSKAPVRVPLVGLDPDGDVVGITALEVEDPPLLGVVTVEGDGFRYSADAGAGGVDEFSFEVADSHGATTQGRARVVVVPQPTANRPPVAVPDRVTVAPGETRLIDVLANDSDPDGDEPSILEGDAEGPTKPALGEVAVEGGLIAYTAPRSVSQTEEVSFTYGITDGPSGARGVVTVRIEPGEVVNEPPVARDDALPPQLADSTVVVDVLGNDRDVDDDKSTLTVALVDDSVGEVRDDGSIQVKLGSESVAFVYRLSDPAGAESLALVSIPVVSSLPPVTEPALVEIDAGTPHPIDLLDYVTDPADNDDDLEIVRVLDETVKGGDGELDGSIYTFTPETDWFEAAGFSYVVTNGDHQALGSVRVRITGQDIPPTFRSVEVTLPEGGKRQIDLQGLVTDPDTDAHTFTLDDGQRPGVIDALLSGDLLSVEAGLTAKGETTELALTVADAKNDPLPVTIPVTVDPNDRPPPVAVDDNTNETDEGESINIGVLRNDIDNIGEGLTLVGVDLHGGSSVGTATVVGDEVRFAPRMGWFGTALMTYRIADASDREAVGSIRVNVFGRPGQPTAPSGEASSHQVRLAWGAPTRNGAPITGYVVEVEGGRQITLNQAATATVVDGLTNDQGYRFRVAALNRVVTSAGEVRADEWSQWSASYTPDAIPEQPGAPTARFDAADNAGGAGQILHVAWTPPSVDGSAITSYTVSASPAPRGQPASQVVQGNVTSLTWGGLTNGTPYRFRVTATNNAGDSPASPDSAAEIPAGVPSQVSVSAERLAGSRNDNGGLATVSWGASDPMGDPGGLRYRVVSSPATPMSPHETGNRSVEWSGLDVNTEYTFTVTAFNKAGDGPASGPSTSVRAEGRPDSPAAPRFLPGNGQVDLTGISSENPRGPGTVTYEYSTSGSDAGDYRPLTLSGSNSRFFLSNGERVSVWVRACKYGDDYGSAPGCSSGQQALNPETRDNWVVPYGPPSVSGTPSGSSITWRWSTPSGASSNPASSPHTIDYGPGPARTQSLGVTINWQGVSRTGPGSAATEDTRQVSLSHGEYGNWSDCSTSPCRRLHVDISGFPGAAGTTRSVECWGNESGSWERFYSYPSATFPHENCYFGYPGRQVRVHVDGVRSNTLTW